MQESNIDSLPLEPLAENVLFVFAQPVSALRSIGHICLQLYLWVHIEPSTGKPASELCRAFGSTLRTSLKCSVQTSDDLWVTFQSTPAKLSVYLHQRIVEPLRLNRLPFAFGVRIVEEWQCDYRRNHPRCLAHVAASSCSCLSPPIYHYSIIVCPVNPPARNRKLQTIITPRLLFRNRGVVLKTSRLHPAPSPEPGPRGSGGGPGRG